MAEKYSGIAAGKQMKASDVEAALDLKANASDMTSALALKEDASNKKTSISSTSDTEYPTSKAVYTALAAKANTGDVQAKLPVGTILMYSGSGWVNNSTLPGWYKCDGSNGTPNLVNKFVRGGATSGGTGGADSVKLTTNHLPGHTHANTIANTLSVADHTHGHSLRGGSWGSQNTDGLPGSYQIAGRNAKYANDNYYEKAPDGTAFISTNTHKHTLAGSVTITNASAGKADAEITAVSTVPGYYTLIYIMRVA
ncbi:MAG: hypothetical protein LBQ83_07185 [Candidatus Margulisbacteria bacterium]|jgi:hypothetical protein|nr:hypothetical protein [Candidatus Margulisiibacteriota bacterium]